MPGTFLGTILRAAIPVCCLAAAGIAAHRYPPGPKLRSTILHFAAGVVFSVVSVELLPDIVRRHAPWEIALGFGLGVAAMIGLGVVSEAAERRAQGGGGVVPVGLVAGVAVDLLVDGLLLGIVSAAGAKAGLLLALALAFELVSLGLALGAQLAKKRIGTASTAAVLLGTGITFFAGAAASTLFASVFSGNALEILLSFGLAALLFLVTEELLVEAHEEGEGRWQTVAFFAGFLLFLVLGMVA